MSALFHEQIEQDGYQFMPDYQMGIGAVQYAVGTFFEEQPELPQGRFVGVVVDGQDEFSNTARWLERQEFEDAFKDDADKMKLLYEQVEDASTFLLVLDRYTKLPAGVMRLVGGESAYQLSLPVAAEKTPYTEEEIREFHDITGVDRPAWDVATMAIAKPYRSKVISQVNVSGMLERMFVEMGDRRGIQHVFALLDHRARKRLVDGTGVPFNGMHDYNETFEFSGSEATSAVYGHFPDFRGSVGAKHEEIQNESLLKNVARLGLNRALRRRVAGRVAGMAAFGKHNVDNHIVLPDIN